MDLSEVYYTVERLEGDYAYLRKEGNEKGDEKLVARALLPQEIREGCRLRYALLEYEMAKGAE